MDIEILKGDKDSVKVRFENKDSTFANALKDELWSTKGVDAAALDKKHPLVGKPELMVHGKEAKKLIKTAAQNIKKKIEEFEKEILKQI